MDNKINNSHNANRSCQMCGHHITPQDQMILKNFSINNSLNKNMFRLKNGKIPLDSISNDNPNLEYNLKNSYTIQNQQLNDFEYSDNNPYRNNTSTTYNKPEMNVISYDDDYNKPLFQPKKTNKKREPMDSYEDDYNENNNNRNSNISNINSITLSNYFNNDNSDFNFNNSKNYMNLKNSNNNRRDDNYSDINNINKNDNNSHNIEKKRDNVINQFQRQNVINSVSPQNIINIKNIYKENGNNESNNNNNLVKHSNNKNSSYKKITMEKCDHFSFSNKNDDQNNNSLSNDKKNLILKSLLQVQSVISEGILSSLKNDTKNNNNNTSLEICVDSFTILPQKKKLAPKIDLNDPLIKNRFMNHNINIYNMLQQINFFQRLSQITKERFAILKKKYQKENFFMNIEEFDNIFINESDIGSNSPLTLIFHYIFNPSVSHIPHNKNFFESIFLQRGDQIISINYSEKTLKKVPKFFNDFNYVNNLFYRPNNQNNFNRFLDEILLKWKNTFSFELEFRHQLSQFNTGCNVITMRDVPKIYFISPTDLVVDYHSYASNFPLSDVFVSISQYRFHCDIQFNVKKGKFEFKTSLKVYNTIKLVKECLLQKTIKSEANNTNKKELQINTWKPMKNTIQNADKDNMEIANEVFDNYLKEELVKYSTESPSEYDLNLYFNEMEGGNNVLSYNSNNSTETNLKQTDINIMKNNYNDFIRDCPFVTEKENNKLENEENDNNAENEKKKINTKGKNELMLKFGIILILLLFILKSVIAFYNSGLCFDAFFNAIICIVIGFIVSKLNAKN